MTLVIQDHFLKIENSGNFIFFLLRLKGSRVINHSSQGMESTKTDKNFEKKGIWGLGNPKA